MSKANIVDALRSFATDELLDSGMGLFKSLGYTSGRRLTLSPNSAETFLSLFAASRPINAERALLSQWRSVDFLFQLTDEEVSIALGSERGDFNSKGNWNDTIIESYLFLAIDLQPRVYTRTELANATRALNRLFSMPALVLFKHGETLTVAMIDRRLHKRDLSHDVLEKVTLIKDVRYSNPHRAHIEILHDLSFPEISAHFSCRNFVELHSAWQQVLSSSELNKRFFQEITNWYFWATDVVVFPRPSDVTDEEAYIAQSVIRLVTRLIFCWFLKEKGLLPVALFDKSAMRTHLRDFRPEATTYYKAVLQNLFFGALNCEMGARRFDEATQASSSNTYRYRALLNDPDELLEILQSVPFMNGGLFECLDRTEETKPKVRSVRVDGFDDGKSNHLSVPNELFFGQDREVDLSDSYGDARYRETRVSGLIHILERYKFTITENTPIEEEIALDPELLGKVFENLLATYNPETKATARKQTGSYYTPREIVDFMVDEALVSHLSMQVRRKVDRNLEEQIRRLLSYDLEPHQIAIEDVQLLIEQIDDLRIIDPACGSGAFPMGVLHKLVLMLTKLDPVNNLWKAKQVAKVRAIPDPIVRERLMSDLSNAFEKNDLDYGRKLFLIENCIFGVDIQPIAVQISKLRFFISLLADEAVDDRIDNRGVRTLPNLETRFVAANALVSVGGARQQLRSGAVEAKEAELENVRNRHFVARTAAVKQECREEDARLRGEISLLVKQDGWGTSAEHELASWDPYDQNASAKFFDAEWMFGVRGGFDIVIANPPYVDSETMVRAQHEERKIYSAIFESARGNWDYFVIFVELGYNLLRDGGVITYIVPNKLLSAPYAENIRTVMAERTLIEIRDYSRVNVFKDADVYPIVFVARNSYRDSDVRMTVMRDVDSVQTSSVIGGGTFYRSKAWDIYFRDSTAVAIDEKCSRQRPLASYFPRVSGAASVAEAYEVKEVVRELPAQGLKKPFKRMINTGTLDRYVSLWGSQPMRYLKDSYLRPVVYDRDIHAISEARLSQACSEKLIIGGMTKELECFYDAGVYLAGKSTVIIPSGPSLELKYLLGILNSSLVSFWYRNHFKSMSLAGGYLRIGPEQIRSIPIPEASDGERREIIRLVDKIIALRASNASANTEKLENQVDDVVYRCYDLTDEEVQAVKQSDLSR